MNVMKPRLQFFPGRTFLWLVLLFAAVWSARADVSTNDTQAVTNETHVAPLSVFTQPSSPKDGRDPFFPASLRPYASAVVPNAPTTDLTSLVLQGTSGTPEHRLVIINKVTFGVGDEAEVSTAQGRIRIHCLAITDDAAVVEAGGVRQILRYGGKP
jgi:hypothetical protein